MEQTKRTYKKHKKGYKIGINYFLNKQKKSDVNLFTGETLYPLYITVRVMGQSTTIKSRLIIKSKQEPIDYILQSENIKPFIDNEKKIIEETIRILRPENLDNFEISDWFSYYQIGLLKLEDFLNLAVNKEIKSLLKNKYSINDNDFYVLNKGNRSLPILELLTKLGVKESIEMKKKYESILKLIWVFYDPPRTDNEVFNFCVWDVLSGFFQREMTLYLDKRFEQSVYDIVSIVQHYVNIKDEETINKRLPTTESNYKISNLLTSTLLMQ